MPANASELLRRKSLGSARKLALEQYPDAGGERFYRIVMAVYKKMAHYQPHSSRAAKITLPRL